MLDGVDQYTFPDFDRVRLYEHEVGANYPLDLAILPRRAWIVSGSDKSFARVFDHRTGHVVQLLDHPRGMIDNLGYHLSLNDHCCVLSHGPGTNGCGVSL